MSSTSREVTQGGISRIHRSADTHTDDHRLHHVNNSVSFLPQRKYSQIGHLPTVRLEKSDRLRRPDRKVTVKALPTIGIHRSPEQKVTVSNDRKPIKPRWAYCSTSQTDSISNLSGSGSSHLTMNWFNIIAAIFCVLLKYHAANRVT
ncbi:Uncharacterised protein r2_g2895 [Pycnogonum litorale]